MDHLRNAADNHVADGRRPIPLHNVLEGTKKIFLEAKVGKLALLDELHGQLAEGVDSEESHIFIAAGAHLVEVVAEHLPDARPLQTDTPHVVVRNLDDLLQTEHPRLSRMGQLL